LDQELNIFLENEYDQKEERFEPRESISSRGGLNKFGNLSTKRDSEYTLNIHFLVSAIQKYNLKVSAPQKIEV